MIHLQRLKELRGRPRPLSSISLKPLSPPRREPFVPMNPSSRARLSEGLLEYTRLLLHYIPSLARPSTAQLLAASTAAGWAAASATAASTEAVVAPPLSSGVVLIQLATSGTKLSTIARRKRDRKPPSL